MSSYGVLKRKNDLEGRVFSRLTAIRLHHVEKREHYMRTFWECRCECGKIVVVRRDGLLRGNNRSCGCINEVVIRKKPGNLDHVMSTKIYNNYKSRAKKMGVSFTLSKDEFFELLLKNCYYCGAVPNNIATRKCLNDKFKYGGVDRIDSSRGYDKDNVVPCCKYCNVAKMDFPVNEFFSMIKRVYEKNHLENYKSTMI
jgi:hypothetical protein